MITCSNEVVCHELRECRPTGLLGNGCAIVQQFLIGVMDWATLLFEVHTCTSWSWDRRCFSCAPSEFSHRMSQRTTYCRGVRSDDEEEDWPSPVIICMYISMYICMYIICIGIYSKVRKVKSATLNAYNRLIIRF